MNSLPMLTVDGTEYESDKCSIKYTRRFIYVGREKMDLFYWLK
jgi:hypothetical protein